jgi:hypothetical protein
MTRLLAVWELVSDEKIISSRGGRGPAFAGNKGEQLIWHRFENTPQAMTNPPRILEYLPSALASFSWLQVVMWGTSSECDPRKSIVNPYIPLGIHGRWSFRPLYRFLSTTFVQFSRDFLPSRLPISNDPRIITIRTCLRSLISKNIRPHLLHLLSHRKSITSS